MRSVTLGVFQSQTVKENQFWQKALWERHTFYVKSIEIVNYNLFSQRMNETPIRFQSLEALYVNGASQLTSIQTDTPSLRVIKANNTPNLVRVVTNSQELDQPIQDQQFFYRELLRELQGFEAIQHKKQHGCSTG